MWCVMNDKHVVKALIDDEAHARDFQEVYYPDGCVSEREAHIDIIGRTVVLTVKDIEPEAA